MPDGCVLFFGEVDGMSEFLEAYGGMLTVLFVLLVLSFAAGFVVGRFTA